MTVITIDSAEFCCGPQVAESVAKQLRYESVSDDDLFSAAAEASGLPAKKLSRAVYGPASFFAGLVGGREKQVAYVRSAMAQLLGRDNWVYHGMGGHLIPTGVSHVLKVGLIGAYAHRLQQARAEGLGEKEARKRIEQDDESHASWSQLLYDGVPWDRDIFDLVIPMHETSLEDAVALVGENAQKPAVASTTRSAASVEDFRLAAAVTLALAEKGHEVDVTAAGGEVEVLIRKHSMFLGRVQKELAELAQKVPGVTGAIAKPGPRYREPDLYVNLDIEMPRKILLVDDEREFIQTLSERLQTRDMDPVIAFDGEEALEKIDADEPEVMVLDLKMPGIDGLEVLRRVRGAHPATEVIILTGHGSAAEERLAEELGAFAYLRKPVDINQLTKTMQAAYRRVAQKKADASES